VNFADILYPVPALPDLAVIDRAIELVEMRNHYAGQYTCHALMFAEHGTLACRSEYARQYGLWIRKSRSRLPVWWGTRGGLHIGSRITALKSFRQACIDAANRIPSQEVLP